MFLLASVLLGSFLLQTSVSTRGVLAEFEGKGPASKHTPVTDSRVLPRFALFVPQGLSPSLFLPPGPFRLRMRASLRLRLRDRFRFAVQGRGRVTLRVGDKILLQGSLPAPGNPPLLSKRVRLHKGDNPIELTYLSPGKGPAQIRLLWQGSDFPLEPLPPHLLTCPPPPKGDTHVRAELAALSRASCLACHKDGGLPEGRLPGLLTLRGPDLRGVRSRLRRSWFLAWVQDPKALRPSARMPRLLHGPGSLAAASDLAAFLGLDEGKVSQPDPALAQKGANLYEAFRCASCHSRGAVASSSDKTPFAKIPLAQVAHKFRQSALAAFLRNPVRYAPRIAMPRFPLASAQAAALAAFLRKGISKGTPMLPSLPSAPQGDAERGKVLFSSLGCVACHQADGIPQGAPEALPYLRLPPGKLCPKTRTPKLPLSRLPIGLPADEGGHALSRSLRCTACHEGSVKPALPSLESIGEKLRPSALTDLLQGKAPRARPWLKARMPSFASFSSSLVRGLTAEVGLPAKDFPSGDDAKTASALASVSLGKKLVSNSGGFSCVLCHGVGKTRALQVFEVEGINFALVANRLRKPFFDRWMWNPQRMDPGSKMPRFGTSEGTTAFTEILDGDAKKQFDAIWTYLESLKKD